MHLAHDGVMGRYAHDGAMGRYAHDGVMDRYGRDAAFGVAKLGKSHHEGQSAPVKEADHVWGGVLWG